MGVDSLWRDCLLRHSERSRGINAKRLRARCARPGKTYLNWLPCSLEVDREAICLKRGGKKSPFGYAQGLNAAEPALSGAERGRDDKKARLYRKSSHRLRPVPRKRLRSSVELLPLQRRRLILFGAFVCCVIPSEARNRSLPSERASRVRAKR